MTDKPCVSEISAGETGSGKKAENGPPQGSLPRKGGPLSGVG